MKRFTKTLLPKFLLLTVLIASQLSYGQVKTEKQILKEQALEHITNLKESVLLVRLFKNKTKVDALIKAGKKQAAEDLMKEVNARNQSIITAFKQYYKYSKVYFFYSDQSREIINGKYNGVVMDGAAG